MMRSLYTAATGMEAQDLNISVISNNLANVNTTGFKKSRAEFQDLLYQTIREAGTPVVQGQDVPNGIQTGHGVRASATQKIFTQGDFRQTDNPLDLVIEGDGFFQIQMPDGQLGYSRDGAFKIDAEGNVVNSDGFYLEPQITIPEGAEGVAIGIDGTVVATVGGEAQQLGQITIARFINPAGLKNIGRNLMVQTTASGAPIGPGVPGLEGRGTIQQGYIEMSNVSVADEMVQMIVAQRAYEVNSKAISTSDQMLGIASSLKR
ncbi:MAG: flagellar basal-body rod protein FlgG [Candidatus Muiribacterium halophilum]|uniref:Flagellar basal-body rod protein FlgG n=1 Tax=Muiribacterium halophilum TaxID=2053465 RepID=A0A2N5ZCG4_MUIH1|nr:MAG: flagellar basal-body rod protein FlgG [Candidatus Muirbacterium halophilum]